MVQDSKFAIRLLEKIGAPLAAAIESVNLEGDDADVEAAKLMAQMLGQTVQVSIALNGSLNAVEDEAQADSTRLALAGLSAPLIANFYRQNSRVPEDQDIKRFVKSLEAVLAFAENFTPAEEGKSRLSTIDHEQPLFDSTQSMLVVMQVMTPVINAIAEFPFGQSEIKLVQEVSEKLRNTAADIVKKNGGDDKLSELLILKSLAQIYTDCHRSETQRLSSASDENRGDLSLDPIWDSFATHVAMLETISGTNPSGAEAEDVPKPAEKAPETPPPSASQPEESTNAPEAKSEPAAAPAAAAGGPMGFFKPGTKDAGNGGDEAPKEPQSAPATPAPEAKAPEPKEQKSEQPAPAEAPKEPAEAPSAPPSGPMGFFKPGAKKAEDEEGAS